MALKESAAKSNLQARSGVVGQFARAIKTGGIKMQCWQTVSAVMALLAAGFWAASALIRVPDLIKTKISGRGSITDIMKRQSALSAIAAMFAGLSALAQALLLFSN